MTYPIRELTVAPFIFLIYLITFYLFFTIVIIIFYMSVFVNDTDLNQCFGLFSSIYIQQSWFIIKDTKISFLNIT